MRTTAIDSSPMAYIDAGMTPRTCKAARVLIDMPQIDLAMRAGVSVQTVRNFENEESVPSHRTWVAIKRALEKSGVVLIDEADGMGPGVRLRVPVK